MPLVIEKHTVTDLERIGKKLRVGGASVSITPPVGIQMAGYSARTGFSQGIHDNLYSKALVLDDGEQRGAIIRCDLIGLHRQTVERVRNLVEAQTGISGKNVLVTSTHTHSGPVTTPIYEDVSLWMNVLIKQLAGVVSMACRNLREARIGVGHGSLEGISINRRKPSGPIDPEVTVLRIDDQDVEPLAALVNFSCHAVVLGPDNLLISADYPGYTMGFIEKAKGIPMLFVNGACGDINPLDELTKKRQEAKEDIYDRTGGTFKEAKRLGTILGAEALETLEQIETIPGVKLKVVKEPVRIPLQGLPTLGEIRKLVEQSQEKFNKLMAEKATVNELYLTGMQLFFAKEYLKLIQRGEKALTTELQLLGMNDIVLLGVPGELFVEIGLNIKRKSKFKHLCIAELANDAIGYIPTKEAFGEPGYEVRMANWLRFPPEVGEIIKASALKLIEEM